MVRPHLESIEPMAEKKVIIGAQGGNRAREGRTAAVSLRIACIQI